MKETRDRRDSHLRLAPDRAEWSAGPPQVACLLACQRATTCHIDVEWGWDEELSERSRGLLFGGLKYQQFGSAFSGALLQVGEAEQCTSPEFCDPWVVRVRLFDACNRTADRVGDSKVCVLHELT